MAESIIVHGAAGGTDDDGYPLPAAPDRTVTVKKVQPLTLEELVASGRDGQVKAVRVWCPPGVTIAHKDEVTIRGERYTVEKPAWDYAAHRRPANPRHRPSVVFEAFRGVG